MSKKDQILEPGNIEYIGDITSCSICKEHFVVEEKFINVEILVCKHRDKGNIKQYFADEIVTICKRCYKYYGLDVTEKLIEAIRQGLLNKFPEETINYFDKIPLQRENGEVEYLDIKSE